MMTADSTDMAQNSVDKGSVPPGVAGVPNEAALLALMERTGFGMIQENGQRKYGGPPPGWEGPPPPRGCEIFVGKIPRDCFEDSLVPIFEKCGKIYELRLMMDFSGSNRGYCFVMYTDKQDARRAVKELNNYEIRKGRLLGVCMSVDNCRLFVGGIPKNKHKEEILQEMEKVTEGVMDVIVYPSATDKTKNRGFAFVEYESHRAAAMARRKLIPGRIQLWGHQIAVDWAEPEQEVDEDVMSQVKILYVRNLMLTTTEETIEQAFNNAVSKENAVERVKKIRDYAFVHYREREDCLRAIKRMDGANIDGSVTEVVLAKPVDKTDYVRYTRGGGRGMFGQTYPFGFEQNPFGATYYGPQFGATVPGGSPPSPLSDDNESCYNGDCDLEGVPFFPAGRGQPRMPVGIRPRGRGAAGSRGAGGRGYLAGYMRGGFRPKTTEDHLYDIVPGMELTPTNPITLKPQSSKSPVQILEEVCSKNGWGTPTYQLNSTVGKDGSGDVQLFLHKVSIPALSTQFPNGIQANKLCRSPDDAKNLAAEYVLNHLGLSADAINSPDIAVTAVVSPVAPPTSIYQARAMGPTVFPVSNGAPQELTYVTPSMPVISAALTQSPGEFPYDSYQQHPSYASAHHYY